MIRAYRVESMEWTSVIFHLGTMSHHHGASLKKKDEYDFALHLDVYNRGEPLEIQFEHDSNLI